MTKTKYYIKETLIHSDKDHDFGYFKESYDLKKHRYFGKIICCQCCNELSLAQLCNLRDSLYTKKIQYDNGGNLKNSNDRTSENEFQNAQIRWFWKNGIAIEVDSLSEFKKLGGKIIIP